MGDKHQRVMPCGRLHDHEEHTWYSRDDRRCPGVVAPGLEEQSKTVEPEEGPDDGHTFRITFTSRGSYKVVGDEHHHDAPDFDEFAHSVDVRAWNLRDALHKAADLPFDVLMGNEL